MNEKKGFFLSLVLTCLCVLPSAAAAEGSIGPLQNLRSFGLAGLQSFLRAGDLAYFTVNRPIDPQTLWRTDGTQEGTFQLAAAGWPAQPGIRLWSVQGSRVFFTAPRTEDPAETQRALWVSDGTVEGTVSLTPGIFAIDASAGAPPTSLAIPETGTVFFSAGTDPARPDYELWATDGTAAGTRLVKDVNPEGSSNPGFMAALGGELFFLADTPQGRELWRSDGTPAGTGRIESLHHLGTGIVALTRSGDALFLLAETAAGVELWRSDGTAAGTSRVLDLPSARLLGHAAAGPRFFLAVGEASPENKEIWAVDADTGGAVQVLETAAPGSFALLAFGNGVLFTLSEAGHGLEPWTSDGTPEGTRRIADVCPGPCDSSPALLGVFAGRALFLAEDGTSGREPWSSDGTAAGTRRAGDLCPGACSPGGVGAVEVAGWVALASGGRFWLSDGSQDGAFQVAGFSAVLSAGLLPPLPGRLLFSTLDPAFTVGVWSLPVTAPPPPPHAVWLESARVPGFRFKVLIDGQTVGRQEPACMARTLCVSGALPGRSEVFVRLSGLPTLVKLTTSAVDVWILHAATGRLRHYRLNGTDPASSTLDGILDREGFGNLPEALDSAAGTAKKPKKPKTPPPPGRWIEAKGVPGFRVQARLTSEGTSRILRKEPCIAETFCLSGVPGTTDVLVRVTGPRPNGYSWTALARFVPATLEVWIEQRKTGKVRYYRLEAPPAGSSELDGYVDRQGFKK